MDRFIPRRSALDLQVSKFKITRENAKHPIFYEELLDYALFEGRIRNSNILPIVGYKNKSAIPRKSSVSILPDLKIMEALDIPGFHDDFYCNTLDWSISNLISLGLEHNTYLITGSNRRKGEVITGPDTTETVTCTSFSPSGNFLAIGKSNGILLLWDLQRSRNSKVIRSLIPEVIMSCAWMDEKTFVYGTSRGYLRLRDTRTDRNETLYNQGSNVCGLAWNCNATLLASGSNDNTVSIWDLRNDSLPYRTIEKHQAAVKALDWDPSNPRLLVSGGGTADKCVYLHHMDLEKEIWKHDMKSQVCFVGWIDKNNLATTHGFSDNDIRIWDGQTGIVRSRGRKHTSRVISAVLSPDKKTLVSASGDEVLYFWDIGELISTPKSGYVKKRRECPIR